MSKLTEIKIGNIYGFDGGNYAGNVYDADGICPCLRTFGGGNQQPMVIEYEENTSEQLSDTTT